MFEHTVMYIENTIRSFQLMTTYIRQQSLMFNCQSSSLVLRLNTAQISLYMKMILMGTMGKHVSNILKCVLLSKPTQKVVRFSIDYLLSS